MWGECIWGGFGREEEFMGDYCWESGELKMFDLGSNHLVPEKKTIKVVEKSASDKFNEAKDKECAEEANRLFMSKLPKFPKAMLERMKVEAEKVALVKLSASNKFYTWMTGAKASAQSRTAFGHRRNGGGKSKAASEIIFKKMNSDEAVAERAVAKRIRQKANKEKAEEVTSKYAEVMKRMLVQKAEMEVPKEVFEVVVIEETDWQVFKREELEAVRSKLRTKTDEINYEAKPVVQKTVESGWTKVDSKAVKNDKTAFALAVALYKNKRIESKKALAIAVEKKPMSEKVTYTLMCSSVAKNEKCPHPEGKCNFAHCAEELKPRVCANVCCKFIKRIGEKVVNKGFKMCAYIHEGETKMSMCNRIGVTAATVIIKPIITVAEPVANSTPVSSKVLKPFSSTSAWAPVDLVVKKRKSRWGTVESEVVVKKSRWGPKQ